jgi:acyl carrier protein
VSAVAGIPGIVAGQLAREARNELNGAVTPATPLGEHGLALSSLGFVRALICLEDDLGIELDYAVMMASDLQTVGDVIEIVTRASEGPP